MLPETGIVGETVAAAMPEPVMRAESWRIQMSKASFDAETNVPDADARLNPSYMANNMIHISAHFFNDGSR